MRPRSGRRLAALAGFLLLGSAAAAESLRCDRGLVSEGDAKAQVLRACGEPAFEESRREERTLRTEPRRGTRVERRATVQVDEWTFNLGPGQFVYYVTFANGRVVRIEHGGYGYPVAAVEEAGRYWDGRECTGGFRLGDRKFDVLVKCGQPLLREEREEERAISVYDRDRRRYREHRATFLIDEWTYNFGPNRFLYFLRFTDGRLTEIETGGYGY